MKNKILLLFFVLIFLIIFFVFYKGLKNSNIYTPNINLKKNIPSFKVELFDNKKIVHSDEIFLNDKFYLINIWASWCAPCRDEHPFLLDLSKHHNLKIIGLNYKDKVDNAKRFLKELKNPYEIILNDKDGTLAIEWGAYGVPETFIVYKKEIVKKIIGPINKNSLLEIYELIQ